MRDRFWILGCVLVLFGGLFSSVLFRGHQFIYRDAGHFYYPYFQFINQEWDAGRWPLWNPHENSGSPLLANPTSSVLYPGKLLFFLPVEYTTAYRWYIMLHVLLSAATAYGMARYFGASVLASGVCGLSYAFSGPVLLQHANIVFLVGAAWAPAAIAFADRAVRKDKARAAIGLGVVLSLQVLGGDPQMAYLCGLLSAVYAAGLFVADLRRRRTIRAEDEETEPAVQPRGKRWLLLALAAGVAAVLSLVQVLPTWQFKRFSSRTFSQVPRTVYGVPLVWLGARTIPEGYQWYDGLLGSGPPVPHNIYDFSTEPWRFFEMVWPNLTGRTTSFNTRWDLAVPGNQPIWTPTLYGGLLPFVLALGAFRWRGASAPERWLGGMGLFGLVGCLGLFGAVWLGRVMFGAEFLTWQAGSSIRSVGNEVGGLYWLLTVTLPGFAEFRYPSKLLVFAALGISGLAAVGWDRVISQGNRRVERLLIGLAIVSLVLLGISLMGSDRLAQELSAAAEAARDPYDGPLDIPATIRCIQGAFLHTAVVAAVGYGLLIFRRRQRWAKWVPTACVALVAMDLGVANHWLIATGPQSLFEAEPHALRVIREAEEKSVEKSQPYRVYRPALFQPLAWSNVYSESRADEGVRWERDSLAPKYGLPYHVDYASVLGTLSLYDYEYFFAPWTEAVDPALRRRNPKLPDRVVRFAPRSLDLWNVKYFVLPWFVVPTDEYRGIGSLLVDPKAPTRKKPILFTPPDGKEAGVDYQVVLNPDYFPRAWLVHRVRTIAPIRGFEKQSRDRVMQQLMLDDSIDLSQEAIVETDRADALTGLEIPAAGDLEEICEYLKQESDLSRLKVRAAAPALLVVAETFYPGWEATLDGKLVEILRTNRMMRGVIVPEGEHTVTFQYRPKLIYRSAAVSATGWALLLLSCVVVLFAKRAKMRAPGR